MDMFLFLKQKHHFITLNILYMIMSLFLSGGEEEEEEFLHFFFNYLKQQIHILSLRFVKYLNIIY